MISHVAVLSRRTTTSQVTQQPRGSLKRRPAGAVVYPAFMPDLLGRRDDVYGVSDCDTSRVRQRWLPHARDAPSWVPHTYRHPRPARSCAGMIEAHTSWNYLELAGWDSPPPDNDGISEHSRPARARNDSDAFRSQELGLGWILRSIRVVGGMVVSGQTADTRRTNTVRPARSR